MTSSLGPEQRAADLRRLGEDPLDVLVVGGGVTGAGAALDAATRGLAVGIVEAQDWASGTSSVSSRLIHGGLRYLEMFDFALVHEALRERGLLLNRLAPHLVHQVPFLYPLRHRVWERAYVTAGVTLYDLLAWSTRYGRGVPHHKQLSRTQALDLAPGLRSESLVGALAYWDAQVDDARLVVELVRTAVSYGALAANRARVTGFTLDGERVTGAQVVDTETGDELVVHARSVLLATGPWTEETESLAGTRRALRLHPSKGVHLVVPKDAIHSSAALIVPTEKSVLFVLPWNRHWMIGTTDTEWKFGPARPVASAADVDYLLDHVNAVLARPLGRDRVEAVFAGLRPLVAGAGEATTKLSREHAIGRPRPGLVVVSGGKYTTYRVMARDAVDAAVAEWTGPARAGSAPRSCTERIPLDGAPGFPARWNGRWRTAAESGLAPAQVEHLLHRHGSHLEQVLDALAGAPGLARRLHPDEDYLAVEVVHAVLHEGARHLDDVLLRRLRLGTETADRGLNVAEETAGLMAPLLGWDEAASHAEVAAYRRLIESDREAAALPTDTEAHEAAA